jgi:hypothetical protein
VLVFLAIVILFSQNTATKHPYISRFFVSKICRSSSLCLSQDEQTDALPSDGEIHLDCRPLSEHAAVLEVLKPKYAAAPPAMALPPTRNARGHYRSIGEISVGQAVLQPKVDGDARFRPEHRTTRRQSSDGEQLLSRQSSVESRVDNGLSVGRLRPFFSR